MKSLPLAPKTSTRDSQAGIYVGLTPGSEIAAFEALQLRLGALWNGIFPGDEDHYPSVVVPSLTLDPAELQKLEGVSFYEERLLFLLSRLRNPEARLGYVTLQPVHPLVRLLPPVSRGRPASHARGRLTLLSANDASEPPIQRPRGTHGARMPSSQPRDRRPLPLRPALEPHVRQCDDEVQFRVCRGNAFAPQAREVVRENVMPQNKGLKYGFEQALEGSTFEQAIDKVTAALKAEGFGVLTTIDVKDTLKKKLGIDFLPYVILGACNPVLAHKALIAEPQIGLLLPCNVVVQEATGGGITVSAQDPQAMFAVVDNPALQGVDYEAEQLPRRVIASLV